MTQVPFLDAFLNETLRFKLNFHHAPRSVSKDVQLGKYKLEKGTEIRPLLYGANISENNFYDPDKFLPDRFLKGDDNEYNKSKNMLFSFGFGNFLKFNNFNYFIYYFNLNRTKKLHRPKTRQNRNKIFNCTYFTKFCN